MRTTVAGHMLYIPGIEYKRVHVVWMVKGIKLLSRQCWLPGTGSLRSSLHPVC